ncbi:inositol polyphosphate 5-phosphatase K isoform X2 [Denticeps clupeoides]|uniref:inositol polyphosphate 5-phosphatase K isoform X2 n=1 Tax=Denticeps clupeoides TaxID=299321 RepID=UPI0010A56D0B|nr:inositol polyphosphate 5-phosphatase K-like isoform X2 [Denticeps clupeoides]
MAELPEPPRLRSDSSSTTTSQSTSGRQQLRQRLSQLLTCMEDLSSDDEVNEEVSRTLDEAFQLCGSRWSGREFFRCCQRPTTLRLHMVTWNVATAEPPADISSLLQLDSQTSTDLYIIGLQEVRATPIKYISDLIMDDSWSYLLMSTLAPKGYVKVTSVRMQGLLLLFFAQQAHLPFIRDIETTYTRTGFFGYWGNKGGVSVRFSLYGHMLCFLNCHLMAHMGYTLQRVDEFEYILDMQSFDLVNTPQILDHNVVFWFGDLNFRIADHGLHFLRSCINSGRFHLLWERDQLTMMKKKEPLLQEFEEGPLHFRPTYKFNPFSDTYDTSGKKRKPAWTDRILWRVKPKAATDEDEKLSSASSLDEHEESSIKVTQDVYTCNMEYGVSDHKPVMGIFTVEMNKKFETPLVNVAADGQWSADEDAVLSYTILETFPSSTSDWIGLYKIGFKSPQDFAAFAWVKDNEVPKIGEVVKIYMNKDKIPLLSGEYVLGYVGYNTQSIVGLSLPFQIMESKQAVLEGLLSEDLNGLNKAY